MKDKINIFLDSNALYSDPLFKTSFGRLLIQLSDNNKINLLISRVVHEESINNFEKRIKKNLEQLEQIDNEFRSLLNNNPKLPKINTKQLISQFEYFYKKGIENNTFQIVEYKDSYLKELIRRSIKRISPFTEHRQEFRDAVIWISYMNLIKENKLTNNFFITNNKRDFWNSEKNDLHPELRGEINDLKIYSSLPEFCSKEKTLLKIKGEKDFSDWILKNPIDDKIIVEVLLSRYWNSIKNIVLKSIDTVNPSKYFSDNKYVYFQYQYTKKEAKINSLDVRQITDFAFIKCNLKIDADGFFYSKENIWQKEKNKIEIILSLSFNLNQKLELRELKSECVKLNLVKTR